jgi:aminoglycoside 3-N-acetyltransferase
LLVHSSLASPGRVIGGPDAVIDALLDSFGREGTLNVPTFTAFSNKTLFP